MRSSESRWGPIFVAGGAFLWATDAVFRSQVISRYTPAAIVCLNHVLCLIVCLPWLIKRRQVLLRFSWKEWLALTYIAIGGSALAMVLFTKAFASATQYTVPILLQKLQPLFAIILARLLLRERLTPGFYFWALLALAGAYLVSFGDTNAFSTLTTSDMLPALYAVAAAAIWGGTTVAGRFLLASGDFTVLTTARFTIASLALLLVLILQGDFAATVETLKGNLAQDAHSFTMMAFFSGLFALMIYYLGLQRTRASVATLCELAFPVGAIAINWLFLDTPLTPAQLVGAGLLLIAVSALSIATHQVS